MKKIAVFTSGGDAPGMNAAVRAVVRYGISKGFEVYGIRGGYQGLLSRELVEMNLRSVSNTIQNGGTILKTSRSEEFRTPEGRKKAAMILDAFGIEGLVGIGGDGTYRGLLALLEVWKGRAVGVPGTIDNDLYGTDFTIGYDTAVNTALEAIDKIRDTADSHERFFVVEVMGRHAGFIALQVGISGGAEAVFVPEEPSDLKTTAEFLSQGRLRGKTSSIIVVAEGDEEGGAKGVAEKLKVLSGCDYHTVILGHIQRGGRPTANDRVLATKLAAFAVDCLLDGKSGVAAGEIGGRLTAVSLEEAVSNKKPLDGYLLGLIPHLSK